MAEAVRLQFASIQARRVLDLVALLGQNGHLIGVILPTQGHPLLLRIDVLTRTRLVPQPRIPLKLGSKSLK